MTGSMSIHCSLADDIFNGLIMVTLYKQLCALFFFSLVTRFIIEFLFFDCLDQLCDGMIFNHDPPGCVDCWVDFSTSMLVFRLF